MAVFIGATYDYKGRREFHSEKEAKEYLKSIGKKSGRFYWNIFGWDTYLTLEPTMSTPSGKLKGFPRTKIVRV